MTAGPPAGTLRVYLGWVAGLVLILVSTAAYGAVSSSTGASVKAHLADESVVLFPNGFSVEREAGEVYIRGSGRSLPVSQVAAIEYYNERLNETARLRTALHDGGIPILKRQSSASVYAFDGSAYVLEGEAFSNNILASIEANDLDRLATGGSPDGNYNLRISNHAWETQYVNSLHLEVVDHAPEFEVLPTRKRKLMLVGPTTSPEAATSRDGREVSELLAARDEQSYETAPVVARMLTEEITNDWVEFEVTPPSDVRRVYLAMRVRNTLFGSFLLEDAILTGRGAETIDLLGGERFRVLEMWRLYRWVRKNMGLRVLVDRGGRFVSVDRIGGTGPSAWRDVVVRVPVRNAGPTRIRLSFLADSWQVDWVGVSFEGSDNVRSETVPLVSLETTAGLPVADGSLDENDDEYLNLYPGEAVEATFRAAPPPAGLQRSYFVETRGYIVKWLRPAQLLGSAGKFKPSDEDVFRAARRWLEQKAANEDSLTARTQSGH